MEHILPTLGVFNESGKIIFPPNCIVIPHFYKEKIEYLTIKPMNEQQGKYRNLCNSFDDLSPKRFFGKNILENLVEGDRLYICEGVFDTMIASQLKLNAIGILGVNHIPFDELKELAKKYKIILALDNDKAGEDATQKIINFLGKPVKVLKINGCKDLTEVYSKSRKRIGMNPYMKIIEVKPSRLNIQVEKGISLISARGLMKLNIPKRNWIVPNFLYPGLALLTGRPKHGKSCLSFDFANAVVRRKKFLNKFRCVKGKVVYISYEEGVDDFKERITSSLKNNSVPKEIIFTCRLDQDENGNVIPHLTFPKLNEGGFEELERILKTNKDIKLVVLDPLGKTLPNSSKSSNEYKIGYEFLGKLQQLALKYKISILVVHHDKKGEAKSHDQLILGTTALAAAPDILMSLWKDENDGVLHINGRGLKEMKYYLSMKNGSWELSNKKIEFGLTPEQSEILSHFKKSEHLKFSTDQITRIVHKKKSYVSRTLKKLCEKRFIKNISTGKYKLAA